MLTYVNCLNIIKKKMDGVFKNIKNTKNMVNSNSRKRRYAFAIHLQQGIVSSVRSIHIGGADFNCKCSIKN